LFGISLGFPCIRLINLAYMLKFNYIRPDGKI
jgi:hypothetical protein